jgi:hypothetical protein
MRGTCGYNSFLAFVLGYQNATTSAKSTLQQHLRVKLHNFLTLPSPDTMETLAVNYGFLTEITLCIVDINFVF